jgi:hypothetical protein
VNRILEKTDNPSLDIQIAAVRKLKSGDLDLYTYNVAEKERLLENSGDWLAQLEQGQAVRVMGKQYASLHIASRLNFTRNLGRWQRPRRKC